MANINFIRMSTTKSSSSLIAFHKLISKNKNKVMKKLLLIILLFTVGTSFSQETQTTRQKRNPEKFATAEFEMLKKRIADLSEPQIDSLQAVYTAYGAELTAIQAQGNRRGKIRIFTKADADKSDKVKNILTEQQWPVYEKLNNELKQKMMERRKKK